MGCLKGFGQHFLLLSCLSACFFFYIFKFREGKTAHTCSTQTWDLHNLTNLFSKTSLCSVISTIIPSPHNPFQKKKKESIRRHQNELCSFVHCILNTVSILSNRACAIFITRAGIASRSSDVLEDPFLI